MKRQYGIVAIMLLISIIASFVITAMRYSRDVPDIPMETEIAETNTQAETEPVKDGFVPFPVPLDTRLQDYINNECELRGIPTSLAIAVIWRESRYVSGLTSNTADYGLMQVNAASWPDLIKTLGIKDLLNDYQNCKVGVAIMARAWDQAGGDVNMAAMAYKAPNGARRYWAEGIYSTPYSRSIAEKMAELEAGR